MPVWRCPHCATPQPESARCWVCGRLTTTCAACRHYRRGVAGGLGLCGRNPRRLALRGTEVLPCWEALPVLADPPARGLDGSAANSARGAEEHHPRTFVPVDEPRASVRQPVRAVAAPAASARPQRWSLWGDPEA